MREGVRAGGADGGSCQIERLRCPLVCSALWACQRERGAFPEEARLCANEAVTDLRPVTCREEEKRTNEEGRRRERARVWRGRKLLRRDWDRPGPAGSTNAGEKFRNGRTPTGNSSGIALALTRELV